MQKGLAMFSALVTECKPLRIGWSSDIFTTIEVSKYRPLTCHWKTRWGKARQPQGGGNTSCSSSKDTQQQYISRGLAGWRCFIQVWNQQVIAFYVRKDLWLICNPNAIDVSVKRRAQATPNGITAKCQGSWTTPFRRRWALAIGSDGDSDIIFNIPEPSKSLV